LARPETPPEPRRASGLYSGRLLLDPTHRVYPDLSGSPLPDRRCRRARGRSLLAGLLLDCIRNLALATRLNPTLATPTSNSQLLTSTSQSPAFTKTSARFCRSSRWIPYAHARR